MLQRRERLTLGLLLVVAILNISIIAHFRHLANASGEIRICADGSIDPPGAPIFTADGATYVLVSDVDSSVKVERDNIVIDGEEHVIRGIGLEGSHGVTLIGRNNVTIINTAVKTFWCDICLEGSSNCTISECNLTETTNVGILLTDLSSFNNITFNIISHSENDGIRLSNSSDFNCIRGNRMTENFIAISVDRSANSILIDNNITMNHWGITIEFSANTLISGNSIANGYREAYGIYLASSTSTIITRNKVANSSDGLVLLWSSYNVVFRNIITQNYYGGIYMRESSNNSIYENMVSNNEGGCGISMSFCSGNSIYHNGFVNNGPRIYGGVAGYVNLWDNGYPDGGNYWTSYIGVDVVRDATQNDTGSDGIIDEPFLIDDENSDRYPLTKSYSGMYDVGLRVSKSRSIVAEGYNITVEISVTVINYGQRAENVNFLFQICGKDFSEDLALKSRESKSFAFTLDAAELPKGNYTIWAYVENVQNETDVIDNVYASFVLITALGDVASEYGVIDIFDVAKIALAFGSIQSSQDWNPDADINNDGVVDIFDMVVVAVHFGQTG